MKLNHSIIIRAVALICLMSSLSLFSSRLQADTGSCGGGITTLPFNDVMASPFFCQIASAYFSGLTNGTTATTYSPNEVVTRDQMAAFVSRTMDQSLKRGSQRAVAKKWFTPQDANSMTLTTVGLHPAQVGFDGTDLWVTNTDGNSVTRVRPGDGKVLDTWTGATDALGIVCAMGRIFITGGSVPGNLYMIDPMQPAGAVTLITSALGEDPFGLAFDGSRIWTANIGGSVSIVSLNPTVVTTVSTGFNDLRGILYDGTHIWVADNGANTLLKLNSDGSIAQTVPVGISPRHPVFDGTNIWVPNASSHTVTVVRVKDSAGNPLASAFVLATLTDNGLSLALTATFDGERILVTSLNNNTVSMWKAADLTPLGFFSTGDNSSPNGACSDGLNFWIVLQNSSKLARF